MCLNILKTLFDNYEKCKVYYKSCSLLTRFLSGKKGTVSSPKAQLKQIKGLKGFPEHLMKETNYNSPLISYLAPGLF